MKAFVLQNPEANFSYNGNLLFAGAELNFNDESINAIGRSWIFDESSNSSIQHPNYIFTVEGSYQVKLIVTASNGCQDSITKTLVIEPAPVPPVANYIEVCEGATATFNATGANNFNWYTSLTGGISIGSGSSFTIDNLERDTALYISNLTNLMKVYAQKCKPLFCKTQWRTLFKSTLNLTLVLPLNF